MQPFTYERVDTTTAAIAAFGQATPASASASQYLAGGTTLIDLMKLDVMRPPTLVDINALDRTALGRIEATGQGLRLGALAHMSEVADHPLITRDYPMIAQSLQLAASPQIRNMATLGGNVLQRTRCPYFRDVSYANCNKRIPGSGCAALDGFHRSHAVLGVSDACIATYPGDFGQALIALDGTVELTGPNGNRTIAFGTLHRTPAGNPEIETVLLPSEIRGERAQGTATQRADSERRRGCGLCRCHAASAQSFQGRPRQTDAGPRVAAGSDNGAVIWPRMQHPNPKRTWDNRSPVLTRGSRSPARRVMPLTSRSATRPTPSS